MSWTLCFLAVLSLLYFIIDPLTFGEPIQVCVVPHSHIDHGWTSTIEVYFQLFPLSFLKEYTPIVNQILTNMFCYAGSAGKPFIWGEVYYFQRWYNNLTADTLCQSMWRPWKFSHPHRIANAPERFGKGADQEEKSGNS